MTTRRRRVIHLILALTLAALIFLAYKGLSAVAISINKNHGNEQGGGAASNGYTVITPDSRDLARGELVLVNKEHPYSFPDGQELISIYEHKNDFYFVRDKDVLLDKSIMENLNNMMEGFAKETGLRDVNIVSGQRSFELQQQLYDDALAENGAAYTAVFLALPGCSEHHTGLAVDFSIFHSETGDSEEFDGIGSYGWFKDNSWRYGFVQRFMEAKSSLTGVADEPWHLRYVGIPHAYYMKQNNLCLEEYVDLLRQYPYEGEHLTIDTGGHTYGVYFCGDTEVHVPEKGSYTMSGNNVDGFIVTAEID